MNYTQNQTQHQGNLVSKMRNLKAWSGPLGVKHKIILSTATPILIITAVFGIILVASSSIVADFKEITDDRLVELEALAALEYSSATIIGESLKYALLGEAESLEELSEASSSLESSV